MLSMSNAHYRSEDKNLNIVQQHLKRRILLDCREVSALNVPDIATVVAEYAAERLAVVVVSKMTNWHISWHYLKVCLKPSFPSRNIGSIIKKYTVKQYVR